MTTATFTQQQQRPAVQSPSPRPVKANPWQRVLAVIALVPALIGAGVYVAAVSNHTTNGTATIELMWAMSAFAAAGSLALLWLLVAAVNWQIKEAARSRG